MNLLVRILAWYGSFDPRLVSGPTRPITLGPKDTMDSTTMGNVVLSQFLEPDFSISYPA